MNFFASICVYGTYDSINNILGFSRDTFPACGCHFVKMGKYSDVETTSWEVRKLPALWKTTDQNYKNAVEKENAWREIVEAVNQHNDFFAN